MLSFSPDGKKIAYVTGATDNAEEIINLADFDGANLSKLVRLHDGGDPTWSPDGTKIVLCAQHGR
jgi:Tol biopolymer transport system component